MTLTEFLRARIAEDEAAAREAALLAETPWRATYGRQVETARDGYLVTPEDEHSDSAGPTDAVSQHIARHDPARVLARCAADRQIVELHEVAHQCTDGTLQPPIAPPMFAGGDERYRLCPTLNALAVTYADHPDFRGEWREA